MDSTLTRRAAAPAIAVAVLLALVALCASSAAGAEAPRYVQITPACAPPGPGEASCFALGRKPVPASEAGRPGVRPLAARPAAVAFGPSGGLTPALLASAYNFNPSGGGEGQTVAIVDAYDDPNIESDLAKFSEQYGLPACTSGNGCFEKVGQKGSPSSLPAADTRGWSVEVSLDVETVHAACPKCKILLVEVNSAAMTSLGAGVAKAVELGAGAVSNSYGGPEQIAPTASERALFEHPGAVIAAATGDFGYDWWTGPVPDPETPNLPASLPGVVSVGGTTLNLNAEGRRSSETVWNGNGRENEGGFSAGASGGGCSIFFEAPFWQRYAAGFAATGCGNKRLSADVSAVADPQTGFDIYDTYNCGHECEALKGAANWSTIGGTSLSAPLTTALFALAGGANGIKYPSLTLYAHLGGPSLFDVTQGGNGYCNNGGRPCGANALYGEGLDCEGTTACNAAPGYDGPSGVGAPASLEAFKPIPEEEQVAKRKAEEAEAEAKRKAEEERKRKAEEEAAKRKAEEEASRRAEEETARRIAEETARRGAEALNGQPQPTGGQGGTAGFKAAKAVTPQATLRGTRLQVGRTGFLTVMVACPEGATRCEGNITLRTLGAVPAASSARGAVLTLAGGRFTVAGGHLAAVRLRLSTRGRALLSRRRVLRVRVTIAAHDSSGASATSHATATLLASSRR
jgi:hypothetical protein